MNQTFDHFPLRGLKIGISISAGDRTVPLGENPDTFINRLTYQTCSRFLYLGAHIVTGHIWMRDGIMEHLAKRAADFRFSFAGKGKPPLLNRIAWPDLPPPFEDEDLWGLDRLVEIEQIPPPGMTLEHLDPGQPLGQFARMRALTALRQELAALSDMRLCLGGASGKPLRRLPGVLEEAVFTWQAGKPLYLSGALGGITKLICDAILHRKLPEESGSAFHTPPEALSLYEAFGASNGVPVEEGPSVPGGAFDALRFLSALPVPELASRCRLCEDEYLALMTTPDIERALDLCRTGIMRFALTH